MVSTKVMSVWLILGVSGNKMGNNARNKQDNKNENTIRWRKKDDFPLKKMCIKSSTEERHFFFLFFPYKSLNWVNITAIYSYLLHILEQFNQNENRC